MSLSRRSIRRIVLSTRPCSSVRSYSQQNIYSQLEQSPIKTVDYNEKFRTTKSENEYNSSETMLQPVLRSTSFIKRQDRGWSPISLHLAGKQCYRLSTEDPTLIDKVFSNVRASVQGYHIFRQFKNRQSNNDIIEENTQQPQLIGEERQDNAIFKIYFKRISQKTSIPLGSNSIIHKLAEPSNSNNNDRGELLYSAIKIYQLKAGTIEKIVECLTNEHGELDTIHMHILFSTYRTYTNTRALIDTILARYRAVIPASLDMTEDVRQKSLTNLSTALICLITAYKEDFYEPPLYTTLHYLYKHALDRDVQNQCRSLLNRFINEGEDIFKAESPNSTGISEVDNNNNNSKNLYTNEFFFNQREFGYDTQMNIHERSHIIIAEQLTIIDAELLKRVLPHECLTMGANGNNRRGLNSNRILSTVDKTIEQFNTVVKRVIATVLNEQTDQIRARVIEKWIDIARECRQLKNFSSLTAILNGLLSGCIYRLKTAWSYVNLNHCSILNNLKDVFGSCADRKQARAILDKQLDDIRLTLPECNEGTAKYVDMTIATNGTIGKKLRSKKTRDQQKTMIGTVPYLGLYLSDLTYLDSAHENSITVNENAQSSQKLINFDKHRKQFEILAQIKLFQSAANAYTTLHRIADFKVWFDSIRIYEEEDSWNRSFQIEPKETIDNTDHHLQQKLQEDPSPTTYRTRPLKAFPSQVSLESLLTTNNPIIETTAPSSGSLRSTPSLTSLDKISLTSIHSFTQRQQSANMIEKKTHSNHSRSSSASSFLTNASSSQGYMSAQASPANSVANCTVNQAENDTLIAKIQLVGRNDLLYKKVRIGNNERTPTVLKTILDKFGLDPLTYERYCIEQQLPNKRIVLLDHCNVFYALVRQSDDEQIELIVREKTRQELDQTKPRFHPNIGHNRTPSGFSISSTHSR